MAPYMDALGELPSGSDSDGDEETPGGILGALARLAFSPSRASDASGRGSG